MKCSARDGFVVVGSIKPKEDDVIPWFFWCFSFSFSFSRGTGEGVVVVVGDDDDAPFLSRVGKEDIDVIDVCFTKIRRKKIGRRRPGRRFLLFFFLLLKGFWLGAPLGRRREKGFVSVVSLREREKKRRALKVS